MNPNHDLDRILDHALGEYRDAEPLAGMEDRVLRRIAGQSHADSRRWTWMFAAAVVAAVLVVALWLGLRQPAPQPTAGTSVAQPAQQATANTGHVEEPVMPSVQSHPAVSARSVARRSSSAAAPRAQSASARPELKRQFPIPVPLTSEERALIVLAQNHPAALLNQPDDSAQLSIAPIEIKPLASESGAPQGEPQ